MVLGKGQSVGHPEWPVYNGCSRKTVELRAAVAKARLQIRLYTRGHVILRQYDEDLSLETSWQQAKVAWWVSYDPTANEIPPLL